MSHSTSLTLSANEAAGDRKKLDAAASEEANEFEVEENPIAASGRRNEESPLINATAISFNRESSTETEAEATWLLSLVGSPGSSPEPESRESSPLSVTASVTTPEGAEYTGSKRKRKDSAPGPAAIDYTIAPRKCPQGCTGTFEDVADFRQHIKDVHHMEYVICKHKNCSRIAHRNDEPNMKLSYHYRNDHNAKRLDCTAHPNCHYHTLDQDDFEKHVAQHQFRCSLCLDQSKRALPFASLANMQAHIKAAHTDLPFTCTIHDVAKGTECGRKFEDRRSRAIHARKSHKDFHMCTSCNEANIKPDMFPSNRELASHIKKNHPDEMTFWKEFLEEHLTEIKCPHCNKTYSSASNRAKHIRTVHNNEKEYVCSTTDPSDNNSIAMVDAEGEPLVWDFKNNGCEKAFANKQSLIDHVRTEHFGLVRWALQRDMNSGKHAVKLAERAKTKPTRGAKMSAASILTGAVEIDDEEVDGKDEIEIEKVEQPVGKLTKPRKRKSPKVSALSLLTGVPDEGDEGSVDVNTGKADVVDKKSTKRQAKSLPRSKGPSALSLLTGMPDDLTEEEETEIEEIPKLAQKPPKRQKTRPQRAKRITPVPEEGSDLDEVDEQSDFAPPIRNLPKRERKKTRKSIDSAEADKPSQFAPPTQNLPKRQKRKSKD